MGSEMCIRDRPETLAAIFKSNEKATLIGTRTNGYGSVGQFEKLSDGSAIYVPNLQWYTPSGLSVYKVGVTPSVEVRISDSDRVEGLDTQLIEAYEFLDEKLPLFR